MKSEIFFIIESIFFIIESKIDSFIIESIIRIQCFISMPSMTVSSECQAIAGSLISSSIKLIDGDERIIF